MSTIFQMILLNTILSSIMILFVLLAKGTLKNRIKPALVSILWILVMVRLLVPYSVESPIKIWNIISYEKPTEDEEIATEENIYTPAEYTMEGSTIDIPAGITEYQPMDIADIQPIIAAEQPNAWQRIKTAIKSIDIKALLAAIWIVCAVAIVGQNIMKMLIFAFTQKLIKAPDAKVMRAFSRAKNKLRIKRKVDVFIAKDITVPMAYSLLSPKILLPQSMVENMDETKTELIFMHELMHIKRLDIMKNYLWLAAKAIYWFNPLVWVAYRQYVSDTEICCDYDVMKKLDEDLKISYSQSLLDAAKMINKKPVYAAPYMLTFCESETKLRRRIMNILQPIKQSKKQTAILAIMTMIAALCCFTTACYTVQPSPSPTAAMAMDENYADDPTPTPQIIDFDSEGNAITATYSPEATPEALSLDYMRGKTIKNSKDGLDMEVVFNLKLVEMPSPGSFPEADVEIEEFSLDFARRAANILLEDKVYYDYAYIKADYEKRLEEYIKLTDGVEMSENDREEVNNYILSLNNGIENAPIENQEKEVYFRSGKDAQQMMSLKSYTKDGEIQQIVVDNCPGENYNYTLYYSRNNMSKAYNTVGTWFEGEDSLGDETAAYRGVALETVEAICDKEMRIDAVQEGVVTDAYDMWTSYEDLLSGDVGEKCFIFYFTPVVEKKAGIYGSMAKGMDSSSEILMTESSLSEYIKVVVDKDGILELSWSDPQKTKNITTQNATPISINKAIEIFGENIWESESFKDSMAVSSKINITQLKCGMAKITDEDGSQHLVYAYAFIGTQTDIWADGSEISIGNNIDNNCYMLVDALTGEVIDFYN